MKMYSTNLTDNQWQVIDKIINAQEKKTFLISIRCIKQSHRSVAQSQ